MAKIVRGGETTRAYVRVPYKCLHGREELKIQVDFGECFPEGFSSGRIDIQREAWRFVELETLGWWLYPWAEERSSDVLVTRVGRRFHQAVGRPVRDGADEDER